jgi:hypothetical protein
MNVYTVGSIPAGSDNVEIMRNACRAIGEELAKHGHTIVVGSDHEDTIDRYIVEGANGVKKKRTTVLVFPPETGERRIVERKNRLPFSEMKRELPNIELSFETPSGSWHSSQLAATQRADAVVTIGGAEGTDITGHYAFALGTPLLPVAVFGGAAAALWSEFKHLYGPELFSQEEKRYIFAEWGKNSTSCLISALNKVHAKNPFSRGPRRPLLIPAICVATLLVAWMLVFYFGNESTLSKFLAIPLLTLISALLGTALEQILAMKQSEKIKFDFNMITMNALASVIIAFGLLISFYMATVLVTGSTSAATDNFGRLSLAVTLLGLGSGRFLEKSEKILASRLVGVIGGRHTQ